MRIASSSFGTFNIVVGLLWLLCGCATDHAIQSRFPIDVPINRDAGRGEPLIVKVRMQGGEILPLIVDTGASGTLLDLSLEPKLGKPMGRQRIQSWGKYEELKVYAAPKLYLGRTPLMTGDLIVTADFRQHSKSAGQPVMGVLGMDVLEHYCIQFDFTAAKMRLLDDRPTSRPAWGRAFPILPLNSSDGRPAVDENLLGLKGPHSLIDSGYLSDGWLMPQFYRQWTNEAVAPATGQARAPKGNFAGETYKEVSLDEKEVESDGIGLRFLARHLVTLDFPNRTMYLKRATDWPLVPKEVEVVAKEAADSASEFLKALKLQGQLPGWLENESGEATAFHFQFRPALDTITLETRKGGDSSTYHYTVNRASKGTPWRLEKAWRTDEDGHLLQEYPVP